MDTEVDSFTKEARQAMATGRSEAASSSRWVSGTDICLDFGDYSWVPSSLEAAKKAVNAHFTSLAGRLAPAWSMVRHCT